MRAIRWMLFLGLCLTGAAGVMAAQAGEQRASSAVAEGRVLPGKTVPIRLSVGVADTKDMVRFDGFYCRLEDRTYYAAARGALNSWPKAKWRADLSLLDAKGRLLKHVSQVFENNGIVLGRAMQYQGELRFLVGPIPAPYRAKRFRLAITEVPKETKTTTQWMPLSGVK